MEIGRTVPRAASRSSWPTRGSATSRWRSAARTAASRRSAQRSAATKPGVRAATSPKSTSDSRGTSRSSTRSSSVRPAASGRGRVSSRSTRSGARRRASTDSARAEVTTRARLGREMAVRRMSRTTVATGGGAVGRRASMSVMSRTVGCEGTPAIASPSCLAMAPGSSTEMLGAASSTTEASTERATARTMVALPTPSGPLTIAASRAEAPSLVSSSGWRNISSSHSVRRRA